MATEPMGGNRKAMTNNQTNSKTNNDPKMPCPTCGRPNPVSLIYCENEDCIAELHPGEAACRICLAIIPGNSKFCRECGRATGKQERAPSAISGIVEKIKGTFPGRRGQPR